MVNVALSLSTKGPPNITDRHWTLVPLYWALAGMVRFCTELPSGVILSERTRSPRMSGKKISRCVPLTLHRVVPPLVTHVKTARWFRKTVVLSGERRISGVERNYWEMAANFHVWVSGVNEFSSSIPWATRGIGKLMSNTATALSDDLIAEQRTTNGFTHAHLPEIKPETIKNEPATNGVLQGKPLNCWVRTIQNKILFYSGAWGVLLCFQKHTCSCFRKILQVHFLIYNRTTRQQSQAHLVPRSLSITL